MAVPENKRISRISTACGPCRTRKARCNGRSPCQKCAEGNREQECVFIHRRGRYRKDQERQLSQTKDRAIKILYKAVTENAGFPGSIANDLRGPVSSTTIMAGLGLVVHQKDGTITIVNEAASSERLLEQHTAGNHKLPCKTNKRKPGLIQTPGNNHVDRHVHARNDDSQGLLPYTFDNGTNDPISAASADAQHLTQHSHPLRETSSSTTAPALSRDTTDSSALDMRDQFSRSIHRQSTPEDVQSIYTYSSDLSTTSEVTPHSFGSMSSASTSYQVPKWDQANVTLQPDFHHPHQQRFPHEWYRDDINGCTPGFMPSHLVLPSYDPVLRANQEMTHVQQFTNTPRNTWS